MAPGHSMMMRAGPYPFPTVPAGVRYFVALSLVVIVYLLRRSSASFVDDGGLFLLLSIIVLASAWFAGTGAALAVTVLGALLGAADPARPPGQAAGVQMHLALFIVAGLLQTALVAELRRARRVAERQAREAHAAHLEGEAANRMKDEFLATISHELRTPLNAVLGWVHLIRTGKLDDQTARRGLESVERNVRHQAQLTSDLLEISKALTGKLRLDSAPVSLKTVVNEATASIASAASAKDVRLNVSMPDAPVVVRGDANRLRQVIWHLLANAIKFTPRDGVVKVCVEQLASDQACVQVRDTGPGIDPEFLPRIFDRFTQADASPTRSTGGLGVGLSLVREIVERHGGEVQAHNDERGRGAVFTVTLPLHVEDQRVRPVAPAPTTPTVGSARHGVATARRNGARRGLGRGRAGDARGMAPRRARQRQRVARARLVRADRKGAVARSGSWRTHSGARADELFTDGRRRAASPLVRQARSAEAGGAGGARRGNRAADRTRTPAGATVTRCRS
ncbi:MAG: hypothetical protein DMF85_13195 [Acidobacteria bacterium]|nr:MAG: hypothetical protein DMF85_13195 [Acidobacteriota bacterium]